MPVRKRAKRHTNYSSQEKAVLLHGVPLHPWSTRFGHPKTGWNREEIRKAWALLKDELLEQWNSAEWVEKRKQEQARYLQSREWYASQGMDPDCATRPESEPFAERFLSDE